MKRDVIQPLVEYLIRIAIDIEETGLANLNEREFEKDYVKFLNDCIVLMKECFTPSVFNVEIDSLFYTYLNMGKINVRQLIIIRDALKEMYLGEYSILIELNQNYCQGSNKLINEDKLKSIISKNL